jgi:putative membrane protein
MKVVFFLVLAAFTGAVTIFAVQNGEEIAVRFLNQSVTLPVSLLVGGAYVLGMLSGWTVVGLVRRSFLRISEKQER